MAAAMRTRPMEIANTRVPAALVSGLRPARSISQMITGRVTSNRLSRKAMMNSSHDRVAASRKAATSAGRRTGTVMSNSDCSSLAPRSWAARSRFR